MEMKNIKGAMLNFQEARAIAKENELSFKLPQFELWANRGIFDGWVHVWEFCKLDEKGDYLERHYFCTDAYNVFNFR